MSARNPVVAALCLSACACLAPPAWGQAPPVPSAPLQAAYYQWDQGRYIEALEGYLAVLDAARDPAIVDEIAVLTGELYAVHEVAADGRGLVMGPQGRYLAYTSSLSGEERVAVSRIDGPRPLLVGEWPGADPVLGTGGLLAYLTLSEDPALRRARSNLTTAVARGDRLARLAGQREVEWLEAAASSVRVRTLEGEDERTVPTPGIFPVSMAFSSDGAALYVVGALDDASGGVGLVEVRFGDGGGARSLEIGGAGVGTPLVVPGGRTLILERPIRSPVPVPPGVRSAVEAGPMVGLLDVDSGALRWFEGETPSLAADGSRVAWVNVAAEGSEDGSTLLSLDLDGFASAAPTSSVAASPPSEPVLVAAGAELANPALSSNGRQVTYQRRDEWDWEVFVRSADGRGAEVRLSREPQHDLFPRFVARGTVLAVKGEARHRRAYLYDLASADPLRLFHNNTVRTISPEYEWLVSPDARRVAIVAERDGNTVSPERGVYVVDLETRVSKEEVAQRLRAALAAEIDLSETARAWFDPIADSVRAVTEGIEVGRIFRHAETLFWFGSKYITEPGNRRAEDYLVGTLESWGYQVERQVFTPRPGVRTANVIARLPGTVDAGLTYVASSHYDSHVRGPGADDNSSGTTALLEVARVMRDHPQPATIEFAFFTGEEAGLLGSREYVRLAVASGKRIVGALNNDMVGWSNDHRLDNTIRYSNPGIRDIQHGAAMLFSRLITYDALYYKSTDAHAYYEQYGDIVGGIGSYPVLGNPHYHQASDRLETLNQQLVAEVAKTTAATLLRLASLPSRPSGISAQALVDGGVRVTWDASLEQEVLTYRIRVLGAAGETVWEGEALEPATTVPALSAGMTVEVKAITRDGRESWDWGRLTQPL